jgi:hypothetical protein
MEWDESIDNFHQLAGIKNISTPSYSSVVEPINSKSIGRWKRYMKWVAPVLMVLLPFAEAFGYSLGAEDIIAMSELNELIDADLLQFLK